MPHLLRAGEYARKLYAHEEALDYVQTGLEIAARQLETIEKSQIQKYMLDFLKDRAEIRQYFAQYDPALEDCANMMHVAQELHREDYEICGLAMQGALYAKKANYDTAMDSYEKALSLQQGTANSSIEAKILTGIALVHLYTGKYDDALTCYNKALSIQDACGDRKGKASTLLSMSYLHFHIGEFDKMRDVNEQAKKICEEIDDKEGIAQALYSISVTYYSKGYSRKAVELCKKALLMHQQIGNKIGEYDAIDGMGMLYDTLGEYKLAAECFQKALDMGRKIWTKHYFFTYNGFGEVASNQGDFERALEFYQKARDSHKRVAEICYVGHTLNNIAMVHFYRGDYQVARDHFTQAIEFHRKFGMSWAYGFTYAYSCFFWAMLNAQDKLLENIEKLKNINKRLNAVRADAWALVMEGYLNYLNGHYNKACDLVLQGLRITREETGEAAIFAESPILLARIELARHRYPAAAEHIREALDYATTISRKHDIARICLLHAQLDVLLKNYDDGVGHARRSLEYAEKCGMKEVLWQAHHVLAKIYLKQRKMKQTRAELNEADPYFKAIVTSLGDELKEIYLKRKEVQEFMKDVSAMNDESAKVIAERSQKKSGYKNVQPKRKTRRHAR